MTHRTPISKHISSLLVLCLIVLVSACSTQVKKEPPTAEELAAKAEVAFKQRKFADAATLYKQAAGLTATDAKQQLLFRAGESHLKANQLLEAERVLLSLNNLPEELQFYRQLKLADISLKLDRPEQSRVLLSSIPQAAPVDQKRQAYEILLEVAKRSNQPFFAIEQLINLNELPDVSLLDSSARINQIWELVQKHSSDELQEQLNEAGNSVELNGWIELVLIPRNFPDHPGLALQNYHQWQSRYSQHPGNEQFLLLRDQAKLSLKPVRNVTIMLPLNGRLSAPATAIRDGMIGAFYKQESAELNISLVDVSNPAITMVEHYQNALTANAHLVIGPLGKTRVQELVEIDYLPIPVLALNIVERETVKENLVMFSLPPEEEAQQIAERIVADGHDKVLLLTPDTPWGARIVESFQQHYQTEEAKRLFSVQTFASKTHDYSKPIKQLLGLQASEDRRRELQAITRTKYEFDPRRRQDATAIFIAANPNQARSIRPQLKFHYASGLSLYATSHIFTGIVDKAKDKKLNDISFTDMPYTLGNEPTKPAKFPRLFALGFDAMQLSTQLDQLAVNPEETSYSGLTGGLSLDAVHGIVRRKLSWAQFRKGVPKMIAPTPVPAVIETTAQ